jgi:hypothetical protein
VKSRHQPGVENRGRVSQLISTGIAGAKRYPASGEEIGMDTPALRVFVLKMTRTATVLKIALRRREPGVLEEPQTKANATRGRIISQLALGQCAGRQKRNDCESRKFESVQTSR